MTDIFEDWKTRRFIVVGADLLDAPEMLVILTDVKYWALHHTDLDLWCEQNNSVVKGMTVTFPDVKTLTAFCLKWS